MFAMMNFKSDGVLLSFAFHFDFRESGGFAAQVQYDGNAVDSLLRGIQPDTLSSGRQGQGIRRAGVFVADAVPAFFPAGECVFRENITQKGLPGTACRSIADRQKHFALPDD